MNARETSRASPQSKVGASERATMKLFPPKLARRAEPEGFFQPSLRDTYGDYSDFHCIHTIWGGDCTIFFHTIAQ